MIYSVFWSGTNWLLVPSAAKIAEVISFLSATVVLNNNLSFRTMTFFERILP